MENVNISTFNSPKELLKNFKARDYDVALIDISMAEMNGIDLAARILEKDKRIKIIFLTMHNDLNHISKCFDLEISGYLNKNSSVSEIIKAIEEVKKNKIYCSPGIATKLVNGLKEKKVTQVRKRKCDELFNQLTTREKEVLGLVIASNSTSQIADRLFLSTHTVSTHRKNIIRKLGSSNIVDLLNKYQNYYPSDAV